MENENKENKFPPDDMPIEESYLSVRVVNCLTRIKTVGEARQMSDAELLEIDNFGKKSLKEFRDFAGYEPVLEPYKRVPFYTSEEKMERAVKVLSDAAPVLQTLLSVLTNDGFSLQSFLDVLISVTSRSITLENKALDTKYESNLLKLRLDSANKHIATLKTDLAKEQHNSEQKAKELAFAQNKDAQLVFQHQISVWKAECERLRAMINIAHEQTDSYRANKATIENLAQQNSALLAEHENLMQEKAELIATVARLTEEAKR